MKRFLIAITVSMLVLVLSLGAFAADTTVYVSNSGANVVDTLEAAIEKIGGEGGTIILCKETTVSADLVIPEQSGDLIIKADGGSLTIEASTLTIAKNENDNTFVFDTPIKTSEAGLMFFASFNSVHFTENCEMNGAVHFFGGVDAQTGPSETTTGYVEEKVAMNKAAITVLPYTVTVDNGVFASFNGGSYRNAIGDVVGSIAAPLTVNINGGTFNGTKAFNVGDAIKSGRAFSLSGMSFLASDATLTVTGGTFNTPIYVHGYIGEATTTASASSQVTNSDPKYYSADGDVTIAISGGTFNEGCVEVSAEQTAASYNRLHRGNFTVTVTDGATFVNTVFDATQVKAYENGIAKATLTYPANANISVKRFDIVNGEAMTYTEPIRIACIGDSITQGTGAKVDGVTNYENYSYPAQLYKKAIASGDDVIVSNYGCAATGVLNYGGLYYKAGLAFTISTNETDATYVVIGLGTNDSAEVADTAGQIEHFKREYKDLVLAYEKNPSTEKVFGTSAIYRYRFAYNAVGAIRVLQSEVLNSLMAEGKKCQYVDLYALLLDSALEGTLLSSDLLHPDAEGYTLYADAIYNAVFNGVYFDEDFEKLSDIWVDGTNGTTDGDGSKEKPFKHMSLAFSHAAEEVTIHIVGVYEDTNMKKDAGYHYDAIITPMNVKKITFVGEGEGAEWRLSSKILYLFGDVTFDNLKMYYSHGTGGNALYLFCQFNNVTFTETFTTPAPEYCILMAGYCVHNDVITQKRYTPAESVSTDKDCTINMNGGSFLYYLGGNLHFNSSNANNAPYGIYSGNITVNIGKNAQFKDKYAGGAMMGMNYFSGTLTANISSWNSGMPVYTFSKLTNQSAQAEKYDESNNTGTFAINLAEGMTNEIVIAGDINADGNVNVVDVLAMIKHKVNNDYTGYAARRYFDRESFSLANIVRLLRKVVL